MPPCGCDDEVSLSGGAAVAVVAEMQRIRSDDVDDDDDDVVETLRCASASRIMR